MTRARSEGIPPLNDVRRQIFAATNDGQLKPYTDWVDFGQQLKHPESLVNFVAAYGTHPTITSGQHRPPRSDGGTAGRSGSSTARSCPARTTIPATPTDTLRRVPALTADASPQRLTTRAPTTCSRRPTPPTSCSAPATWVNSGGKTITGVDDIDLWVGGLAERTNLFGGLLGSTFNYVFENQLTNLQNGDRFYYLARTPGMNLRAQLEGNSFAELVMRNTPAHTLKADPFATADCKFELDNITWPATPWAAPASSSPAPARCRTTRPRSATRTSSCCGWRTAPSGTASTNTAMPSGINAQAVYNGKTGAVNDRIWGGADNDTFWGGEGNDIIEGGDGADIALGGEGNDIITDLAGDDVPKGGPGNDAIDGGPGLDIIMAGDGNDFTNGGANSNETLRAAPATTSPSPARASTPSSATAATTGKRAATSRTSSSVTARRSSSTTTTSPATTS